MADQAVAGIPSVPDGLAAGPIENVTLWEKVHAHLREEILAVIAKHVRLEADKVQVKMERGESVSTLEVEVEVPNEAPTRVRLAVSA